MLAIIGFTALIGIALIGARVAGYGLPSSGGVPIQGFHMDAFDRTVYLISGHAGHDSGAVCTGADGAVFLTEADVNATVADLTRRRLRRAGADVIILEEFDRRLDGLSADVLLSIHADSCIEASGYKAAHHANSPIAGVEARLLDCIDDRYAGDTNLNSHPNTVTHDMTSYHAFSRIAPDTPAVILETGFLGGDQELLTENPDLVAKGIADSILCFLSSQREP
jgi:N-acetylmuramoyl-L-alanine amidase